MNTEKVEPRSDVPIEVISDEVAHSDGYRPKASLIRVHLCSSVVCIFALWLTSTRSRRAS
jgi:hypothetical protein